MYLHTYHIGAQVTFDDVLIQCALRPFKYLHLSDDSLESCGNRCHPACRLCLPALMHVRSMCVKLTLLGGTDWLYLSHLATNPLTQQEALE